MTNQPSQGTRQASSITWQSRQAAEAWRAMARVHAGVLGQVTERMLDLAALDPGMRVLDVAAGAGEQTLAASRRLGSSGRIIAVDISASMLEAANETMREHGANNVETRVMDAQRLELDANSFDVSAFK
jgi:ubiquinone/menaquinone biosynthesis C-methylase UbiE